MAKRNGGQVVEVWTAAWGWKDGPNPNEYVFATSKAACDQMLHDRMFLGMDVLASLEIVRSRRLAAPMLKEVKSDRVDLFDFRMREEMRGILADIQEQDVAIRSTDAYLKLLTCAGLDAEIKK